MSPINSAIVRKNCREKFFPFPARAGGPSPRWRPVCFSDKSLWTDETDGHLKFVAAGRKGLFHVRSLETLNCSRDISSIII